MVPALPADRKFFAFEHYVKFDVIVFAFVIFPGVFTVLHFLSLFFGFNSAILLLRGMFELLFGAGER
jgi:hypothetical protein